MLQHSEEDVKLQRSCQVVEIFFNSLIECKVPTDNHDSYTNIVNLLFALHKSSFTEQHILNVLFSVYNLHKVSLSRQVGFRFIIESILRQEIFQMFRQTGLNYGYLIFPPYYCT